jgi:hypothetical protein
MQPQSDNPFSALVYTHAGVGVQEEAEVRATVTLHPEPNPKPDLEEAWGEVEDAQLGLFWAVFEGATVAQESLLFVPFVILDFLP